ncbi:patatin-like phospholipase family protein [Eilatimonas milleporae]|uniref:NTE family protein n=1 Tax=Eilatimonas milleporae TaxID=911205 RepID=A0A3M0CTI2_9PROT|nr:patatin-like phospholipase family protein [Eilatimonas milleporae]RMB11720.1 NTE family protein [Eilatimonas milleporae]
MFESIRKKDGRQRPSQAGKDGDIPPSTPADPAPKSMDAGKETGRIPPDSKDGSDDIVALPPGVRRPKIGLALGAGVARGWAHIGVIRRLHEEGVPVDMVAGTSIGAVVGGALAAGQLDTLEDWARSLKEYNFFRFLDIGLKGGLFGGDRLNRLMMENFGGATFDNLTIPFTAVACELKTGHEVWLSEGDMADAIQASFALPGVFEPKRIKRRWLADGALVNPVPVSVCRAAGCEIVIAVNLAEDLYGRRKATKAGAMEDSDYGVFSSIMKDPAALGSQSRSSFLRRIFGKKEDSPSMFTSMVASLNILQNRLSRSRLAGDPPDITINPRVGHLGLMDFHRAPELIEEGVRAFDETLPLMKDAIAIISHRLNS